MIEFFTGCLLVAIGIFFGALIAYPKIDTAKERGRAEVFMECREYGYARAGNQTMTCVVERATGEKHVKWD